MAKFKLTREDLIKRIKKVSRELNPIRTPRGGRHRTSKLDYKEKLKNSVDLRKLEE
jgi:hypothetical protein